MMRPQTVLWSVLTLVFAATPVRAGITFIRAGSSSVSAGAEFFAVADFNRDNRDDLAVTSPRSKELSVLLGGADAGFTRSTVLRFGNLLRMPTAGDLNNDGIVDLAVPDERDRKVHYFLGLGDGMFSTRREAFGQNLVGRSPFGVAIADFDKQRGNDMAVTDRTGDRVFILINDGNAQVAFKSAGDYSVGLGPEDVIAADFTSDGSPDIVTLDQGGPRVKDVSLLRFERMASGLPIFKTPAVKFGVPERPSDLMAADFNGDGLLDLAMLNRPSGTNIGEIDFLFGRGDGLFDTGEPLPIGCPFFTVGLGCRARAFAVGDFDGDGDIDLAISQTDPRKQTFDDILTIFINVGDATFIPGPVFTADPAPNYIAVGHFFGGPLPDLAVGSDRTDSVQVFRNVSDGSGSTPTGDPCTAGDQCATNLCVNDVCCRTECEVGERCDIPGFEGMCTPLEDHRPVGFSCDEGHPEQCLSGFCVDETCCTVSSCSGDERCDLPGFEGECASLLADGSACRAAAHCRSDRCIDGFCCNTNCPDGRCDIPGKEGTCTALLGLGQDCMEDGQCADPSICDLVGRICCAERCLTDEECALDGAGCISSPNPTFTPGVIGAPCEDDNDCIDDEAQFCTDGVCCVVDQCVTGEVCAAGSGECAAPTPTPTPDPGCFCDDARTVPCDANGFCVFASRGGGCSVTGGNTGALVDLLLACALPIALLLARRWQLSRVPVHVRVRNQ